MKRIFFASAWLFLSVGVVLTSVAMTQYLEYGNFFGQKEQAEPQDTVAISLAGEAPIGAENQGSSTIIESADARIPLVQNFLERHKSPILAEEPEFATFLVEMADRYEIDFRLLPAIAMQESNLCKVIPKDSHNCLGLGVHSRGTWGFETYADNFEAAAKILKKNYIDIGLVTPAQIMTKYTPSSPGGAWAKSVNQWMSEMRYDDRALGKELKTDANLLEFTETKPTPSVAPQP